MGTSRGLRGIIMHLVLVFGLREDGKSAEYHLPVVSDRVLVTHSILLATRQGELTTSSTARYGLPISEVLRGL